MTMFTRAWTAPKDGASVQQNEDAHAVRPLAAADGAEGLLVAVADGASEAVYARAWAQALVAAAEQDWPTLSDVDLTERLDRVRRAFVPAVPGDSIPWYVRNKFMSQGSQATLLVATVTPVPGDESLAVQAVAVGDSCLLVCRRNEEVSSFPVHASMDFGLSPILVRSHPQSDIRYQRWESRLQPGEVLIACTDAVAKWALECWEIGQSDYLFNAIARLLTSPCAAPVSVKEDSGESIGIASCARDQISEQMGDVCEVALAPEQVPELQTALTFDEFLECQRKPDSRPSMRDDDSTLVLCVPVGIPSNSQQSETKQP